MLGQKVKCTQLLIPTLIVNSDIDSNSLMTIISISTQRHGAVHYGKQIPRYLEIHITKETIFYKKLQTTSI
jgi:hypothetical protein